MHTRQQTSDSEDTNVVLHSDPEVTLHLDQLAPGVHGYTIDVDGVLHIPMLVADYPGEGDVGRYLDSLPRDRTVKVPAVLSEKLRDMLTRRSFVPLMEWSEEHGEHVEVMIRAPVSAEVGREIEFLRRALRTCQETCARTDAYRHRLEALNTKQRDVVEAAEELITRRSPRAISDARARMREAIRELHKVEAQAS